MNTHRKHMWLMLAGCLIPLAGLVAIYIFKIPVDKVFLGGMVLLCPFFHILMMVFMGKDMKEQNHEQHHPARGDVQTIQQE